MADESVLAAGLVERIGEENGRILHNQLSQELPIPNHQVGLQAVVQLLLDPHDGVINSPDEIDAVGHRVVHGGEKFSQPTIINEEVIATIDKLSPLGTAAQSSQSLWHSSGNGNFSQRHPSRHL